MNRLGNPRPRGGGGLNGRQRSGSVFDGMLLVDLITFGLFVVQRGQGGRIVIQRVSRLGLFYSIDRSGFSDSLLRDTRGRQLPGGWPGVGLAAISNDEVGLHCCVRPFPRDGSDLPQFRL